MDDIQKGMETLLQKAAERLREARLPEELAAQLEQCATQIHQPCVVAVVGQVKAGKSTFINALLGEDLAKVGTTETTATINYFKYGKIDSQQSLRCFWRGGQDEYKDRAFVNSLKGNDFDTLRKADGIVRLEFYLNNPYLEQVTLVDTPGTGSVVDTHQNRTAEYLHLEQQLRKRHTEETQDIGSRADAVIYLISSTAREPDRAFLEEFKQVTQGQSRAFNAIGVMAKIDLYPEVMEQRKVLATKIASQLQESLNTVVPVSAGLQRAVDGLLANNGEGLQRLMDAIHRIPSDKLDKFLDNEQLYLELNPDVYPIDIEEREALLGEMPWTVFTTVARAAADHKKDQEAIKQYLYELTGFDQLKEVLERHFFKRGRILRYHRILRDAQKVVNKIKFQYLRDLRKSEREDKNRQEQFIAFIRNAHGDHNIARQLEALVLERTTGKLKRVEVLVDLLERDFANIAYQLEECNDDFQALREILDHKDVFSADELDELQPLLGLYGLEIDKRFRPGQRSPDYVAERQILWREVARTDGNVTRRKVAQHVVSCYGRLLVALR